ncbi:hypothetical protein [Pseudonocardia sp. TMWB2A]|uniref:hypothetical protein n=1 Tax=Pseudonocardia sp. TMWB2A TaxID=687430 RepID=UPI00307D60BD
MDNDRADAAGARVRLERGDTRRPLPWKAIGIAMLLLLIAFVAWNYSGWQKQADVGTAYGARVGCSCRFVQGRDLESCESDFEPGMGLVSLSEDKDKKRVTASVPLMARHSAHYAGDTGCLLD